MTNPQLTAALAEELSRTHDFEMTLSGAQLLQLVSMLQIALRHPSLQDEAECTTLFVRAFIASVREGFGGFPIVQMVIDKNGAGEAVTMPRPC